MPLKKNLTLFCLLGILGALLVSCTKENSVTIVETVEVIENPDTSTTEVGFRMAIAGQELESDVFAAFCENDTLAFMLISNKVELLQFPIPSWEFEEGDFVFVNYQSITGSWSYGGQALGGDFTGLANLLVSFSEADINIEQNDGMFVVGNSSGNLLGFDSDNNPILIPYSMDFNAEIVQESDFCE
ncbi:MAG: hypothetical protein AAGH79_16455 [Bacteroidota bacterium]